MKQDVVARPPFVFLLKTSVGETACSALEGAYSNNMYLLVSRSLTQGLALMLDTFASRFSRTEHRAQPEVAARRAYMAGQPQMRSR